MKQRRNWDRFREVKAIDKTILSKLVKKEIKNLSYPQVLSIINALVDKMEEDLRSFKEVKVKNFFTLKPVLAGGRQVRNYHTGEKIISKKYLRLYSLIDVKFKNFIKNNLE